MASDTYARSLRHLFSFTFAFGRKDHSYGIPNFFRIVSCDRLFLKDNKNLLGAQVARTFQPANI